MLLVTILGDTVITKTKESSSMDHP